MVPHKKFKSVKTSNDVGFESVHNFNEELVFQEVHKQLRERFGGDILSDEDLICDVACVALNNIYPRYIRHDVDFSFYLTQQERLMLEASVKSAVETAIYIVLKKS